MKFSYQNSLITPEDITKTIELLIPYLDHLQEVVKTGDYSFDEGSINLPVDDEILQQVLSVKEEKVSSKLKYFIDIGIGGSNLGTKAVYDAIQGAFEVLDRERFPKMVFLDTNDPEFLAHLVNFLQTEIVDENEVLINAISKSGGTTETISNLEIVLAALKPRFPNTLNRLVITTDEGSKLWNKAQEKNITTLPIPKLVGGRYSVLSSVGLFPLATIGIDIQALQEGAVKARNAGLQSGVLENSAMVSAVILFLQQSAGFTIHDSFFFHPELESLGKWYRQLTGESLGKEKNLMGETVHAGITPTVSLGSTDLHSVAQLYLGGPKDKVTTFVSAEKSDNDPRLPEVLEFSGLVEGIDGKSSSEIMKAILEGTKIAYRNQGLPFMEIVLDDLSARSLGEFLQFKMLEVMLLGKLLNINTFDQPNVESYKIETKKILDGKIP